jgi:GMC oxidoreductase
MRASSNTKATFDKTNGSADFGHLAAVAARALSAGPEQHGGKQEILNGTQAAAGISKRLGFPVEGVVLTPDDLAANVTSGANDFIICRSGSSGSVVARRLAEHPNVTALLLEAGDDDVPAGMDAGHRTLKVYGVESLWIADGSIMPRVTTVNTMAPHVVIGERDADILRTEHRLSVDAEVNV